MIKQFDSLEEFSEKIKIYKDVYLFGAGYSGEMVGKYLNKQEINWNGYIDNNKSLYRLLLNGKKISAPTEISAGTEYLIIICTIMASKEIEEQLIALGFQNTNIYRFADRSVFYWISAQSCDLQPYLKRLENLKLGRQESLKRCFIIGNGPSLRIQDLERLTNDYTMATNAILKCFSQTDWRPNCYFVEDPATVDYHVLPYGLEQLAKECENIICSIRCNMYKYVDIYENLCFHFVAEGKGQNLPEFSDNPIKTLYEYGSTLYTMLQVAIYIGFKEIYLLGVDLGFAREIHSDGSVEIHSEKKAQAEFLNSANEPIATCETEKVIKGYMAAKKYADTHGIKIYNATRGGQLEVFERVDFDTLFGGKEK